jgi:hypothetical protein
LRHEFFPLLAAERSQQIKYNRQQQQGFQPNHERNILCEPTGDSADDVASESF